MGSNPTPRSNIMNDAETRLKELNALQELQNTALFSKRLQMLESDMERITTIISNIKLTLSQLQMDFDKNKADATIASQQ